VTAERLRDLDLDPEQADQWRRSESAFDNDWRRSVSSIDHGASAIDAVRLKALDFAAFQPLMRDTSNCRIDVAEAASTLSRLRRHAPAHHPIRHDERPPCALRP
jgi:hypothetical protein